MLRCCVVPPTFRRCLGTAIWKPVIYCSSLQNDWLRIGSKNGEPVINTKIFSENLRRDIMEGKKASGAGILVQGDGYKPNLVIVRHPEEPNFFSVVYPSFYSIPAPSLSQRSITFQFPSHPKQGGYTAMARKGIISSVSHFLQQSDKMHDIQLALQELWKSRFNLEGQSYSIKPDEAMTLESIKRTFHESTIGTISMEDIKAHLLTDKFFNEGKNGIRAIPEIEKHLTSYILHLLVISTPFFQSIPESTYYYALTPKRVAKISERLELLTLIEQLRYDTSVIEQLRYDTSFTPYENSFLELNSKKKGIPLDHSAAFGSFEEEKQNSFGVSDLCVDFWRHCFLSQPGKLTKTLLSIPQWKKLTQQYAEPNSFGQMARFWARMEASELPFFVDSFTPEQVADLNKNTFPTIMDMLKDYAISGRSSHPLVVEKLTKMFRGLGIPRHPNALRSLLIALDQLPYMFCYHTEEFRRFWDQNDEIDRLRDEDIARNTFAKEKLSISNTFNALPLSTKNDTSSPAVNGVEKEIAYFPHAYAIDGIETSSYDDAISYSCDGDKTWIHIHVANTSSHIIPNSFTDIQARALVETQYGNRFLRMLPKYADEKISLLKGKPNFVMTFSAQLEKGNIVDYKIEYSNVQEITFATHEQCSEDIRVKGPLKEMMTLAKQRRKFRNPIELNVQHSQADILVEEFMLTAGEVAARFCTQHSIPCLYRHQERVDEDVISQTDTMHPQLRTSYLLRHTSAAKYSAEAQPHFMAGLHSYSHVTSPLRRYADMVAHYQIGSFIQNRELPFSKEQIGDMAPRINARSRQLRMIDREQEKQNFYYYISETGTQAIQKAFVTGVSMTNWGTVRVSFDALATVKISFSIYVDAWPGNFCLGDIYRVKLVANPHLSNFSATLESDEPISSLDVEYPY